jgi:peptidyl-prolyl cis-trans isomerase B (cyclophilin B)
LGYNRDITDKKENGMVTIEMENGKKIEIELLPGAAPNTAANFKSLISKGFYDGLIFHRVISGFMIQGGCPRGTGTGGPGYSIKGEFIANGVDNPISHERGVVSMARAQDPDSAGSQFFIVHEDAKFLDGQYAAFGRVVSGMETVDEIAAADTDSSDRPKAPQVMKSVTLSEGEEVTEPEKAE